MLNRMSQTGGSKPTSAFLYRSYEGISLLSQSSGTPNPCRSEANVDVLLYSFRFPDTFSSERALMTSGKESGKGQLPEIYVCVSDDSLG